MSRVSRWDFVGLRAHRPRIAALVHRTDHVLGEKAALARLRQLAEPGERPFVVVLSGGAGVGKTLVVDWLTELLAPRALRIDPFVARTASALDPDGRDIGVLRAVLSEQIKGTNRIGVYEDVDRDFLPSGCRRLARLLLNELRLSGLLITCKSTPPIGTFRVPVDTVELGSRAVETEPFLRYLGAIYDAVGGRSDPFSPGLVRCLFNLVETCPNFGSVEYVIEMLLARYAAVRKQITVADLYHLLGEDPEIRSVPGFPSLQRGSGGGDARVGVTLRRKDKSERLCDLLMRFYPDPDELVDVGAESLPSFDPTGFAELARFSYREALLALCLTESPLGLVEAFLGPREIRREVEALQLGHLREFQSGGRRAQLLVRGLGFTLVEGPQGLPQYVESVASARRELAAQMLHPDFARGLTLGIVHHMERLLHDLLHFYGSYLCTSVGALVRDYGRTTGENLDVGRLTMGHVTRLLRFLNEPRDDAEFNFKLALLGRSHCFEAGFLRAADEFVSERNPVVHAIDRALQHDASSFGLERLSAVVDAADALVEAVKGGVYPAVIQIKQIVFDEFSRRVFLGVDASGEHVRFSVTTGDSEQELTIASHYFMLPARRTTVNPILVSTAGAEAGALFEAGEAYRKSSQTQHAQGHAFLQRVTVRPGDSILDVGCGDGRTTVRLASLHEDTTIHAIDISESMIQTARSEAAAAGQERIGFEAVGLLDFPGSHRFDLVFSNSTMHWVLPPERAYARLFALLKPGGRLAVHQGGKGCYSGLWKCAMEVLAKLGLRNHFSNWSYPAWYPAAEEMERQLIDCGFADVNVESHESDGREYPQLVENFSHAGLLPFTRQLPEADRAAFRREFLAHAQVSPPDLYTHRLFALATKP